MIKPSVGRIVLYTPHRGDPYEEDQLAAIVTYVHGPRMVNLAYFTPNGIPGSATSVPLLQDDDVAPEFGRCAQWMDYQKGQATKTEALEAKLGLTDPAHRIY